MKEIEDNGFYKEEFILDEPKVKDGREVYQRRIIVFIYNYQTHILYETLRGTDKEARFEHKNGKVREIKKFKKIN